ncbi:MAG: DUF3467 domain-containing protein [Mariprofundales bacterium]
MTNKDKRIPLITKEEKHELQVQMPTDVQHGLYANQLVVSHTADEFVMDFIMATHPVGMVQSRIVVSPRQAKRILNTMKDNISRYEAMFGEIEELTVENSHTGNPTILN